MWALAATPGAFGVLGCSGKNPIVGECSGLETPTSLDARTGTYMKCRRREPTARANRADLVLDLIHRLADEECSSFPVSEQLHALQAATRAFRDDPDDPECVVAALCHDVGGLIGEPHARVSAKLLSPVIRKELALVVAHHSIFNRRFAEGTGLYSASARNQYLNYRNEAWFELALDFTERFDRPSFDPGYDTLPLEHFEPIVQRIFG